MAESTPKGWVLWPAHEEEVVVTLAPLDTSPLDFIGTRHILLSEEKPNTQVGRTSKRETSLRASRHNTFFASPIISRKHALITFDSVLQKVYIEDSGSMHGTRLNGAELEPHVRTPLHTGDVLKFGVGIERGQDCHAPYELKVAIRHGSGTKPTAHPVVYRVPDDTDVDSLDSDESGSLDYSESISDLDEDAQVRHTSGILESHGLRAGSIIYFGEDESLPLGAHIGNSTSQAPATAASDHRKGSKPLTVVDLTNTTDEPAYLYEPGQSYTRIAEASEPAEDSEIFDSNASEASDSPPSEVEIGRTWSDRAPSVVPINQVDEASLADANDVRGFTGIARDEHELNSVLDTLPGAQESNSPMLQSNYNSTTTFSLPPVSTLGYGTWVGPIGIPTLPRLAELDSTSADTNTAMHPHLPRYDGSTARTPDYLAVPTSRQTLRTCQPTQEEFVAGESLAGDQSSSESFHDELRQDSPCSGLLEISAPAETEALMSGAIPSLDSASMPSHSANEKESNAENTTVVSESIEPIPESRKRPIDKISQGETVQSCHADEVGLSELSAPAEKRTRLTPCGLTSNPSKKLRKAAEAIGFVAIGGVAVLSTLIATAPTF